MYTTNRCRKRWPLSQIVRRKHQRASAFASAELLSEAARLSPVIHAHRPITTGEVCSPVSVRFRPCGAMQGIIIELITVPVPGAPHGGPPEFAPGIDEPGTRYLIQSHDLRMQYLGGSAAGGACRAFWLSDMADVTCGASDPSDTVPGLKKGKLLRSALSLVRKFSADPSQNAMILQEQHTLSGCRHAACIVQVKSPGLELQTARSQLNKCAFQLLEVCSLKRLSAEGLRN